MLLSRVKHLARSKSIFGGASKAITRPVVNSPLKKGAPLRMFSNSPVLSRGGEVRVLSDAERLESELVKKLAESSLHRFTAVNPKIRALMLEDLALFADIQEAMKLFVWAKEQGLKIGIFTSGSVKDLQEKIKSSDFFSSHVIYLGSLNEVSKIEQDPYAIRISNLAYEMGLGGRVLLKELLVVGVSEKFMLAAKQITWTACITDKTNIGEVKPNCISDSLAGVTKVINFCEEAMTQGHNFVPPAAGMKCRSV